MKNGRKSDVSKFIADKLQNDAVFKHKVNELRLIASANDLNWSQKAKMYIDFKEKYKMTNLDLAKLFGLSETTIGRDVRHFQRAKEWNIELDERSRIHHIALDMDSKKKATTFIKLATEFKLVKDKHIRNLMNGEYDYNYLKEFLEENHKKMMAQLEKAWKEIEPLLKEKEVKENEKKL